MFSKTVVVYLSTFDFKIEHLAGSDNFFADALSRAKNVDAIELHAPLSSLSPQESPQEQDATLMSISNEVRSKIGCLA